MSSTGGRVRELRPIVIFTAAYMALAVAGALLQGNLEFVFYIGVMAVLITVVALVDTKVRLSHGALWGLTGWGAAHMAGGLLPIPPSWPAAVDGQAVLYTWWLIPDLLKYDQIVHAFGFGITTWVCWQALAVAFRRRGITPEPTAGLLVLCAAGGMGFGALNEVIEFAATLLVPETNVGGYLNTGWDLVANLVGSATAAILIGWWGGGRVSRG